MGDRRTSNIPYSYRPTYPGSSFRPHWLPNFNRPYQMPYPQQQQYHWDNYLQSNPQQHQYYQQYQYQHPQQLRDPVRPPQQRDVPRPPQQRDIAHPPPPAFSHPNIHSRSPPETLPQREHSTSSKFNLPNKVPAQKKFVPTKIEFTSSRKYDDIKYDDQYSHKDESHHNSKRSFNSYNLQKSTKFDDSNDFSKKIINPNSIPIAPQKSLDSISHSNNSSPKVSDSNRRKSGNSSNSLVSSKKSLSTFSPLKKFSVSVNSDGYEKLQQVGEGTYGKVYKAINKSTRALVALKKIRVEPEKDGFPITAIREIRILMSLKHKNIVKLHEIISTSQNSTPSVLMVFEYMEHDLTGILGNPNLKFDAHHFKCLIQQMFEGLGYLHSVGIIHRDMKGSNLLLNSKGELKLADFGLARHLYSGTGQNLSKKNMDYTNRVITLWYRSPELLLGTTKYSFEVDLWSSGCIVLELFFGEAPFRGQNEFEQLESIFKLCGTPNQKNWPKVGEEPWWVMMKPKQQHTRALKSKYSSLSIHALDLLDKLLQLDPAQRPTCAQVLRHSYFLEEEPLPCKNEDLPIIEGDWHEFESKIRKKTGKLVIKPSDIDTQTPEMGVFTENPLMPHSAHPQPLSGHNRSEFGGPMSAGPVEVLPPPPPPPPREPSHGFHRATKIVNVDWDCPYCRCINIDDLKCKKCERDRPPSTKFDVSTHRQSLDSRPDDPYYHRSNRNSSIEKPFSTILSSSSSRQKNLESNPSTKSRQRPLSPPRGDSYSSSRRSPSRHASSIDHHHRRDRLSPPPPPPTSRPSSSLHRQKSPDYYRPERSPPRSHRGRMHLDSYTTREPMSRYDSYIGSGGRRPRSRSISYSSEDSLSKSPVRRYNNSQSPEKHSTGYSHHYHSQRREYAASRSPRKEHRSGSRGRNRSRSSSGGYRRREDRYSPGHYAGQYNVKPSSSKLAEKKAADDGHGGRKSERREDLKRRDRDFDDGFEDREVKKRDVKKVEGPGVVVENGSSGSNKKADFVMMEVYEDDEEEEEIMEEESGQVIIPMAVFDYPTAASAASVVLFTKEGQNTSSGGGENTPKKGSKLVKYFDDVFDRESPIEFHEKEPQQKKVKVKKIETSSSSIIVEERKSATKKKKSKVDDIIVEKKSLKAINSIDKDTTLTKIPPKKRGRPRIKKSNIDEEFVESLTINPLSHKDFVDESVDDVEGNDVDVLVLEDAVFGEVIVPGANVREREDGITTISGNVLSSSTKISKFF